MQRWLIVGMASLLLGSSCLAEEEKPKAEIDADARYRSTLLFANVLEMVRDEYFDQEKVDYDALTHAALRGMLDSLDPHSQFLNPQEYTDMKEETQGKFGGIGISVGKLDGHLTVNVPIEGTPAFKAGILPGDRIVKIEGKSAKGMSLSDAVRLLRGKPETEVSLNIYRPDSKETKEIKIIRALIDVPTVKDAQLLPGETIGYIRITQFGDHTVEEFETALEKLQKEGMTSLVLDLRNNPGGLLEAAVEVAGKFLPKRTAIVSTEGRLGAVDRQEYFASVRARILDLPLVALINTTSASGAEIVAGALKDLRRAVVIGTTTFGKGSVQTVQPVDRSVASPSAARLTTALYYTPARKMIHKKGIEPHISAVIPWEDERDLFLKRSLLYLKSKEKARVEKVKDIQLARAVAVLKGMQVFAQRNPSSKAQQK